jgi:hypothetical protein
MHPTVRSFYNLEEVWGGKQVALKKKKTSLKKKKPARGAPARRRARR